VAPCKARLVIEAENAPLLCQSLAADNAGYVEATADGGRLVARCAAADIGSLLATLDDLLVNLKVADEILGGHGAIEGAED